MISNISLGSWNPICSERFLTNHLSIDGALDNPSAFCEIQGKIKADLLHVIFVCGEKLLLFS